MVWNCRLIEKEEIPDAKFGDMWFAPCLKDGVLSDDIEGKKYE